MILDALKDGGFCTVSSDGMIMSFGFSWFCVAWFSPFNPLCASSRSLPHYPLCEPLGMNPNLPQDLCFTAKQPCQFHCVETLLQ